MTMDDHARGLWEGDGASGADFGSATTAFREALSKSWPSPDDERRVVEAFERYTAALGRALQARGVSEHAAADYDEYVRRVREAFASQDARARVSDAFERYVTDLKQAWGDVDPATVPPETLAALAEAMRWVATVAATVRRVGEDPA